MTTWPVDMAVVVAASAWVSGSGSAVRRRAVVSPRARAAQRGHGPAGGAAGPGLFREQQQPGRSARTSAAAPHRRSRGHGGRPARCGSWTAWRAGRARRHSADRRPWRRRGRRAARPDGPCGRPGSGPARGRRPPDGFQRAGDLHGDRILRRSSQHSYRVALACSGLLLRPVDRRLLRLASPVGGPTVAGGRDHPYNWRPRWTSPAGSGPGCGVRRNRPWLPSPAQVRWRCRRWLATLRGSHHAPVVGQPPRPVIGGSASSHRHPAGVAGRSSRFLEGPRKPARVAIGDPGTHRRTYERNATGPVSLA
jgi:hypothetical protein